MARPVELIPLACVRCATPVPASPEEAAWVCANCGQGMSLDLKTGLQAVEVYYRAGIAPDQVGKPFWVAEGQVQVSRETYSGDKDREARQFWSHPRRFFVPAFSLPLENLLQTGSQLLLRPPELESGPPCRFAAVTLPLADMRAVAEFIAMAVEADRKDKLREVHLQVALKDPSLWIMP